MRRGVRLWPERFTIDTDSESSGDGKAQASSLAAALMVVAIVMVIPDKTPKRKRLVELQPSQLDQAIKLEQAKLEQ